MDGVAHLAEETDALTGNVRVNRDRARFKRKYDV